MLEGARWVNERGEGVFGGVAAGISDTAIKTGGCARLRVRILCTGYSPLLCS